MKTFDAKLTVVIMGLTWALVQAAILPPLPASHSDPVVRGEPLAKPILRMIPGEPDLIYRNGQTVTLICEADFPLDWKLPSILETRDYGITLKNELEDRLIIEDQYHEPSLESPDADGVISYSHRSILTITEASYTDTGYYACHHRENEEGDDEVKVYVYVEDEDNLIVQHRQVMMFSQRLSRYSAIVPCKPSHPDIEMFIMTDKETKADWVYDPHVGFYVENDVLNGPASPYRPIYRCVARHPKGFEADTPVYVWQPFKPLVSVDSDVLIQMPARRILMNQHFQLNCSITYYQSQNLTVELHWMVPQLRGIDGRRVRSEKVILNAPPRGGKKRTTVRLSLRVTNATIDDGGFYMCASHLSSPDINSMDWAEVFVNIHHKDDENYLLVSTPYNDGPRDIEAGKSATFVVYVDARPDPTVNWYRGDQPETLNTSSKYVVHRSWGKTYLKIRDLSVEDSGIYRLVATAGTQIKILNFTLVVDEKRSYSSIMSWRYSFDYVSPLFWIHAQPAIIGFSYLQCRPPLPCLTFNRRSGDNDETVWDVDTRRHVDEDGRIVLDPLIIYINTTNPLNVASGSGNEVVPSSESERFFYLGWVVNTLYNSTGNGTWLWTATDGTTLPLNLSNPPPGFNVTKRHCLERRGYCYRIKGINTNSDELGHSVNPGEVFTWTYASAVDGIHISVPIQIQDAHQPVIRESSRSQVAVSLGQPITLFCLADGLPTPTSQWLKNGLPISEEWIERTEYGTYLKVLNAEDSDIFTCRFENIAGNAEHNIQIHVAAPSA